MTQKDTPEYLAARRKWNTEQAGRVHERETLTRAAAAVGQRGDIQQQRQLQQKIEALDAAMAAARNQWEEAIGEPAPASTASQRDYPYHPPSGERWGAACHEAAHGLALLAFGGSVERIEVHEAGGGRCVGEPPARALDQLLIAQVGEVAERVVGGWRCSQHDCAADRAEFDRLLMQLEDCERYVCGIRALGMAEDFVVERADDIRRLALLLYQRSTLSGDEVAHRLGKAAAPRQRPTSAGAGRPAAQTTGRPLTRRDHDELAAYAKQLMSG